MEVFQHPLLRCTSPALGEGFAIGDLEKPSLATLDLRFVTDFDQLTKGSLDDVLDQACFPDNTPQEPAQLFRMECMQIGYLGFAKPLGYR